MADALTSGIRRAISDPNSIAGDRRGPGFPEGHEAHAEVPEPVLYWQTRAVLTVLYNGRYVPDMHPRPPGALTIAMIFCLALLLGLGLGSVFL